MASSDPLGVRLFGYGVPYQVHLSNGDGVVPLATTPTDEARDLALELRVLRDGDGESFAVDANAWAFSTPFGRCGVGGLPHEHLMVHHANEAWLDLLSSSGYEQHPLRQGEITTLVPGMVARVRARPQPGRRVVVAFQTEDRTPLLGNAAPFTLDGEVPDDYAERLIKTHAAFSSVKQMAERDPTACGETLIHFFDTMAARLAGDRQVSQIQEEARIAGAYEVEDETTSFARQRELLTDDVLARIESQDELLFRFPGMFGGITTLFNAMS
ncbi:MAG: hypothetical protein VX911_01740 [Candidatus Latescibacterota bacterium]|nr:hypothetical protein [Candidatus Latescibacterota bacterium]MEE2831339.1 hypothetical protein [Candidatus Latescibacterota bacterium]